MSILDASGRGYYWFEILNGSHLFGGGHCAIAQWRLIIVLPIVVPYDPPPDGYLVQATRYVPLDIVNISLNPGVANKEASARIRLAEGSTFVTMSKGEKLYTDNCESCHGVGATGTTEPSSPGEVRSPLAGTSLVDASYGPTTHPDATFFDSIMNGKLRHCKLINNVRPAWGSADCVAAHPYEGHSQPMPGFSSTMADSDVRDIIQYVRWLQLGNGTCQ
jgi:mono/diheme cytochrome c family protein